MTGVQLRDDDPARIASNVDQSWTCDEFRRREGGERPDESSGEQRALGEHLDRDRATGVGQTARVGHGRRVCVGAQRARRAGRAVERGLEVAGEVVVLELGVDEEDGVDDHRDRRKAAPSAQSSVPSSHYVDDTPNRPGAANCSDQATSCSLIPRQRGQAVDVARQLADPHARQPPESPIDLLEIRRLLRLARAVEVALEIVGQDAIDDQSADVDAGLDRAAPRPERSLRSPAARESSRAQTTSARGP